MSNPIHRLPRKLRRAGLRVKVVKGWRNRGRDGTWKPKGVVWHHTASSRRSGNAASLGVVTNGRSDLPGPLCQVLIARNGTVFIVAAGRSNHAGEGGPYRNIPKDSGNAYLVGVEVENDGLGEPWSKELKETCITTHAVILRLLGAKPNMLIGHKEWANGRKIDPTGINMDKMRDRVKEEMNRLERRRGR